MIDLHVHSTASDGTLTPSQLVRTAARKGMEALAITDHDTVDGLAEAIEEGAVRGVEVVPGVELSTEWDRGIMHILGFFVRRTDPDLLATLHRLRGGREDRTEVILSKLADLGIEISQQEVAEETGGGAPGRPHIARVLIRKNVVSDIQEAFDRFLAKGAPAYAKKPKLTPLQALRLITNAGGLPVLAHPYSVLPDNPDGLEEVVSWLRENGLKGIEVYYPEHSQESTSSYLELAERLDLVVTGGTDFHGANKPGIELGVIEGSGPLPYRMLEDLKRLNTSGR